jgi:EAL domain-containing protein (putative c-di-GMP-specific phosphodiesterase class I)
MLPADDLAADLREAVRHGDLFAVFQPLIDVASGSVVAVEGLCRWKRDHGAPVTPDEFIPLAEKLGLIHEVGRFMLDECLAAVDHWRSAGTPLEVSVNVSPTQLAAESFSTYVSEELSRRALTASALTIEITESLPMPDIVAIVPRLHRLLALGIGVSLDDYGTGHASADRLESIPVTELKLDRSLIQGDSRQVMRALIVAVERARERGLRIVAEGIETQAHLTLARNLRCDRAQGYLLGAPMRIWDVDALLAA